MSPFMSSIRPQVMSRQDFASSGIGSLKNLLDRRTRDVPQFAMTPQQPRPQNPFLNQLGRVPLTQGPENAAQPVQLRPTRPEPVNPFAENEQYQALMEYQKSMAPSQEQQDRLSELRTAFEGTGGYKDYRISQMEQQLQQRQ